MITTATIAPTRRRNTMVISTSQHWGLLLQRRNIMPASSSSTSTAVSSLVGSLRFVILQKLMLATQILTVSVRGSDIDELQVFLIVERKHWFIFQCIIPLLSNVYKEPCIISGHAGGSKCQMSNWKSDAKFFRMLIRALSRLSTRIRSVLYYTNNRGTILLR